MARIVEDESKYEAWKNATRSTVVLKKIDRSGNLIDEVIRGGRTFNLTPDERRLNQEIASTDKLDMFQNGLLSPVRLIEGATDVEKFKETPNHISEDEMAALITGQSQKAFTERVTAITNPVTLKRMLEIAESDEVDATVKRAKFLSERLNELSPSLYTEVSTVRGPQVTSASPATGL